MKQKKAIQHRTYMVKDPSYSMQENQLPPHQLTLHINSMGSFICIFLNTAVAGMSNRKIKQSPSPTLMYCLKEMQSKVSKNRFLFTIL